MNDERINLKNGQTKEVQEEYLYKVKELLKKLYPNYSYALVYDDDYEKYVFIQKGDNIYMETGFYKGQPDLNFRYENHCAVYDRF